MPRLQLLRGLGVVGSALAFTAAVQALPLAEATAINFVSPAFITALSIVFLGEQVGWRRWTAIVVGLIGVLIVIRPGSGALQAAAVFPLLTAASWACAVVVTRRMAAGDPPATTLLWSAGVGMAVLSLLVPFVWVPPTWGEVGLGFLIGAVSTAGHGLVVLAYRVAQASVLAPFSYAQLLTSTLLGLVMFGAVPDGWTLLGAAVIVASGLYTAHRERLRARLRRQAAAAGPAGGDRAA
jgi:drug/metabolite transporter (DMT)-like permease